MSDEIKPLQFFADVHVSAEAIKQLRKRGVNIFRSLERGFKQDEKDEVLFSYAIQHQCIMVTCDSDFLDFNTAFQERGEEHSGILYFDTRTGHCGNIGHVIKTIFYYHEAVLAGAGKYIDDFYNQIKYH